MKIVTTVIVFLLTFQDFIVDKSGIGLFNYIDEVIIVTLLIVSIISVIRNQTMKKFNFVILLLTLLFAIIGIISCFANSKGIFKESILSCFLSTKFWILILSLSLIKVNRETVEKSYTAIFILEKVAIFFALVNICFLDLYKWLFPYNLVSYRFNIIAVSSIFNHPGKYGWFMLFCAFAHFSIFIKNRERKDLYKTIISIVASLLSLRTKVIISIIVCFVFYVVFANKESTKKRIKKSILVLSLSLVLLIPFKEIVYHTYVLYFTDSEGYTVRQALFDNSIKIMKEYFPIGVGFGKYGTWYASKNYSEYYSKYGMSNMYGLTKDNTSYATDTFWPAIFGETGILGGITYIAMILLLFKILHKNNKNQTELNSDISLFALLVLIQIIIESFGSASFNGPPEYFFIATVIGMSISINNVLDDKLEKNDNILINA